MVRRGRRSGVRFIEDGRDRNLTFFKRRAGIFKAAADLSTLTGARVAIVLESERGKFSSFGAPATGPIVDSFFAGNASMGPYLSEEQKGTITELQNELFQLEKDMAVEEKRKKQSVVLAKELQERTRTGKLVFGKEEDLDKDEFYEIHRELSRVQKVIQHRLLLVEHHGKQQEIGGTRDPLLLQPSWWRRSLPSQMPPPKALPWTPIQPSSKFPRFSVRAQTRSQSSILNPMMAPSQKLPPRSLHPSMVSLQAQNMQVPNESIPFSYSTYGVDINGNNSSPLSQSPILSLSPPLPPSPHIQQFDESSRHLSPPHQFSPSLSLYGQFIFKDLNNNSIELPQKYPCCGSTSAPPPSKPYYATPDGLSIELERTNENGGPTYDGHNMFGYCGPVQDDGWIDEMISESSIGGQSEVGVGNNLGGLNLPWN